ncbi:MAG: hypothetical protein A2Y57_00980 [Candidatus Woykebacteria bacterium RBG_13_40_7b]|uniref:Uncharacterized protein n=1 Tax=Candidatus Woykebacteria bacterium RBG_13_40_7b TaxID=1802594 RepID=A0A1G1WBF9_9BACT|nr:MAG: hypothetical protein A2Y57_00980 [Candidatus Woykebacteria bacterium RBG_13_40_7b]
MLKLLRLREAFHRGEEIKLREQKSNLARLMDCVGLPVRIAILEVLNKSEGGLAESLVCDRVKELLTLWGVPRIHRFQITMEIRALALKRMVTAPSLNDQVACRRLTTFWMATYKALDSVAKKLASSHCEDFRYL